MKVLKVLYVLLCAAVVILSLVMFSMVGLLDSNVSNEESDEYFEPKSFTVGDVSITLDESFEKQYYDLSGNVFGRIKNDDTMVIVSKFDFDDYNGIEDWGTHKFATDVAQTGSYKTSVSWHDGIAYYEYDNVSGYYDDEESSHWWCFVFKTDGEFWTVDIGVPMEDMYSREEEVLEWADSIAVYGEVYY